MTTHTPVRLSFVLAISMATIATRQTAAAEKFDIDPSHTSVIFGISHLGYSYTYGRFNEVKGSFTLDRQNPTASKFQLNIKADSVDTNDKKRDQHLAGPDFFNASQFPRIGFDSTKVAVETTDKGTFYVVDGIMELHGVKKPMTFRLLKLGEGPGPQGKFRAGFLCRTELNRSDFDMKAMLPMIGDAVSIIVSFEGVRQQ